MAVLTKDVFVRILKNFADDPEDVIVEKGTIVCKVNRMETTLTLTDKDDILYCDDGTRSIKAILWIERYLARLDVLAERILSEIPQEENFVSVPSVKELPTGESVECSSTTDSLWTDLAKKPFCTSAIYLQSNAGDGKTIVMNRLARKTAEAYKRGEIHFLFLPMELGGQPFMRFDDFFIGELARKFRFRDYYFNSILELVKLNLLVLGLDGFEEMSVEGKDDKVISSLGELLALFESQGKIVISARKAFYEFALENRAALGDVMQQREIEFSAYRLMPWSETQFKALMESYSFSASEISETYDRLLKHFDAKHPILTRPVLAHKLVDYIYAKNGEYDHELDQIEASSDDVNQSKVLDDFIRVLLHREATIKWISVSKDKGGKQLLKLEDHYQVLQYLAEEMWVTRTEFVRRDFLKEWMGIVCGELRVGVEATRACQEKILYHAFLRNEATQYAFCHEAFGMYFLGRQIGCYLAEDSYGSQIMQLLSIEVLPHAVIDEAAYHLAFLKKDFAAISQKLHQLKGGISRNTPLGQNVGALLLAYRFSLNCVQLCVLQDLYLAESAVYRVSLKHVKFEHCLFGTVHIAENREWDSVEFVDSQIEAIEVDNGVARVRNVQIDEKSVPAKLVLHSDEIYNPVTICRKLREIGFEMPCETAGVEDVQGREPEVSEELRVLLKVVQFYSRTYFITENLFSRKFGAEWGHVKRDVFPKFIENQILEVGDCQHSSKMEGYRMICPLSKISYAQKLAKGNFETFLRELKSVRQ